MDSSEIWDQVNARFAHHCDPAVTVFRARNGAIHYRRQCAICGVFQGVGRETLSPTEIDGAKPFDDLLQARWNAQRENQARDLFNNQRAIDKAKWQTQHEDYTRNSPIWKRKRILVLERCKGICEGCRVRDAEIVHHIGYPREDGRELLFELVGLCRPCHDIAHGRDIAPIEAQHETDDSDPDLDLPPGY
jgi:5-methylcytosine-specific restriction endonuclease McrA